MEVRVTQHGRERLFERVYKQANNKTYENAKSLIEKIIKKGEVKVNDAKQMLVCFANNLYLFKKEGTEKVAFITVKTAQTSEREYFYKGTRRTMTYKKSFQCCA